eukprot:NODE_5675_length_1745_cov_3.479604.p1 GENE.NODE_5675_length_1745_cov_3.479604~~NODE_5675_length_1745_cov_3.479604.p1  ORF type:complete len:544 (-),score=96.93 NODE_5675_length_1745_cov_3.479604:113-1693(-)
MSDVFGPPCLIRPYLRYRVYRTRMITYVFGIDKERKECSLLRIPKQDDPHPELLLLGGEDRVPLHQLEVLVAEVRRCSDSMSEEIRGPGIFGFIRFLQGYYLILITKHRRVGKVGHHIVFAIESTALLPLFTETALSGRTLRDEKALRGQFNALYVSKDFYFSHTYNLSTGTDRSRHWKGGLQQIEPASQPKGLRHSISVGSIGGLCGSSAHDADGNPPSECPTSPLASFMSSGPGIGGSVLPANASGADTEAGAPCSRISDVTASTLTSAAIASPSQGLGLSLGWSLASGSTAIPVGTRPSASAAEPPNGRGSRGLEPSSGGIRQGRADGVLPPVRTLQQWWMLPARRPDGSIPDDAATASEAAKDRWRHYWSYAFPHMPPPVEDSLNVPGWWRAGAPPLSACGRNRRAHTAAATALGSRSRSDSLGSQRSQTAATRRRRSMSSMQARTMMPPSPIRHRRARTPVSHALPARSRILSRDSVQTPPALDTGTSLRSVFASTCLVHVLAEVAAAGADATSAAAGEPP